MGKRNGETRTVNTMQLALLLSCTLVLQIAFAFNVASVSSPHAVSYDYKRLQLPRVVASESSRFSMIATIPEQQTMSIAPASDFAVTVADSTLRSAVKAASWRPIAACITLTNA